MEPEQVFADLTLAYYYAAPLVMSQAVASGKPRNQFVHMPGPADADRRIVARPGVDQVASYAWLDLASSPITLQTPSTLSAAYPQGRYLTYQIMDAWTNSIALLGTGFAGGNQGGRYVFTGPGFLGPTPPEYTRISCPTDFTIIWSRTFCLEPGEMPEINRLKAQFRLEPLLPQSYAPKEPRQFPAKAGSPVAMLSALDLEAYFNLFNQLSLESRPFAADAPLLARLQAYGIGPGLTFSLAQFPGRLKKALTDRVKTRVLTAAKRLFSDMPAINGWHYSTDDVGRYGTNYVLRGACAINGYAANPAEMCMYLTASLDSGGERLNGSRAYRVHFKAGHLPPVNETGYWSLVAYDEDGFLMRNPLNRYRLSGWDEKLHYHPDGSLDLFVGPEAPAGRSPDNWLPCGKDHEMDLCLRLYLPLPRARTSQWEPPVIEKMLAPCNT
jgi:hypothetical protein